MAKEGPAFVCKLKSRSCRSRDTRYVVLLVCLSFRAGPYGKYLQPTVLPASGGREEEIDCDYVRQQVYGKGTTVKQIHQEVSPEIGYVKLRRVLGREQITIEKPCRVRLNKFKVAWSLRSARVQ